MSEPKFTGTNPYELMQRSVAGPTPKFTGTNPYELMQQSLAGGGRKTETVFNDPYDYENRVVDEVEGTDAAAAAACAARGGTWNPTTKTCDKKPETPVDNRPVTNTVGGTVVETPPKEGDYKAGADGQPLIFKNGQWEVYGVRNTREIITEDPNKEPVPGADANVPIDKYMESLGTDTLAGKAYAEALARRMASIDEQQRTAGLSYGDMYEQARMSQAARRGMSDVSGMTGGMADQAQSRMSAAEIASLSQIGMGREATMRQLEMAELNAPMEAFQEGAQMDEFERARQMQSTQMQQAETLFEQAQSGWMQDPDTGEWTNIDKQTQDTLSLQAINATQRAELLGEIQYWQSYLTSNPGNEQALANLSDLQTQYGTLLSQSKDLAAQRTPTTDVDVDVDDDVDVDVNDAWETDFTKGTVEQNAVSFITPQITALGITEETALPNFKASIRNNEDLAEIVYKLAGDKAVEGYDFTNEVSILNRAINQPTTLTEAEFNQLKEAGAYQGGDYLEVAFGIKSTQTGTTAERRLTFPQNEISEAFMRYAVNAGLVKEDQVANSVQNNNYSFRTVTSGANEGGVGLGSHEKVKQLAQEFKKWNSQGRPDRKISANINNTGFAAGSSDWLATITGR
jgi:hypothetical protein